MPKFTLEIVPEKKWGALKRQDDRYEFIDNDLGFADVKEGKVFVRQTAWPDLMRETIHHEVDHLFEEGATDTDKHGIRHKNIFKRTFGDYAKSAARLGEKFTPEFAKDLPLVGPMFKAQQNVAQGGKNYFGAFGAPLLAGLGLGVAGGQGAFGGLTNLLQHPIQSFKSGFQNIGRGLQSAEGRLGNMLQFNDPMFGPTAGSGQGALYSGGVSSSAGTGALSGGGGLNLFGGVGKGFNLGTLGNLGTAAGFLGAANRVGTPQIPNLGELPSVSNLRQQTEALRSGQPTSPLTRFAYGDLQTRLQQPFQGVDPLILQQTNDAYDRLRNQYTSQYKMFAPNADITSDSKYAQGIAEIERRRAQDLSGLQQTELHRYQDLQTGAISEALGIDRDTLQSLGALAQLDVDQIMAQTGLDAERASQLRQMFGQVGGLFAARGLGMNQFNIPLNIGQGGR